MQILQHHKRKISGFTLIELLIVIVILGSVGTIVAIILINSLRTSSKTDILNVIKNNGDFALSQIAQHVRYSQSVTCQSLPASPQLTVNDFNGTQTVYSCSGSSLIDTIMNGTTTTTPTPETLLDTNSVAVVANSCNFICTQPTSTSNAFVQILFSLQTTNTGTLQEQTAPPQRFSTSVTLRNVSR